MLANTHPSNVHCAVKQALIKLRGYQEDLRQGIYDEWYKGVLNVCAVLPTGGGKTIVFGRIIHDHSHEPVVAIAHRQELVAQISVALAKYGVRHDILAPKSVVAHIVKLHVKETGLNYVTPTSKVKVAGVDTLKARRKQPQIQAWAKTVKLWVQDECHHILTTNKWGKACEMFPNAKGLGVTATPDRTDGCGLGRRAKGVFDALVVGPSLRDLINMGYLTDYVIYAPPNDIDFSNMKLGSNKDYTSQELRKREEKSHIVGDVVSHYKRLIPGKLAITFASNVVTATELAHQFTASGVPADVVSGKTPDAQRISIMDRFAKGELRQCTNVDIFGEGYDLPAIDAVQMVRKTESFCLFVQQAGRALRPVYAPGMPLDTPEQRKAAIAAGPKPVAYIIDHVGNVARHAVTRTDAFGDLYIDVAYKNWTLENKERNTRAKHDPDNIPTVVCTNCTAVYEMFLDACPMCGNVEVPAERKSPEFVDGDLTLLDPSVLTAIEEEVTRIAEPCNTNGILNKKIIAAARATHFKRQEAQLQLRKSIDQWAGYQTAMGRNHKESYKRYYYQFGVDVMTSMTGTAREMTELKQKVDQHIEVLHDEYETYAARKAVH